jgi:hypothetical protein
VVSNKENIPTLATSVKDKAAKFTTMIEQQKQNNPTNQINR